MKEPKKIAVVGAGIAGLTCAYKLQKAGVNVIVYEKESAVGGRMSTRKTGSFPMDIGANHLANVYTHMQALAKELELSWRPMEFLNYRILKHGKLTRLLDDISSWSKFKMGVQSFLSARKNTDYFDLSTAAKYDTDDAAQFFRARIGQEMLDYVIDPFVSVYQFHRADEISLGAVHAMLRLQRQGDWTLRHFPGGMIALPQALADKVEVKLNTSVQNIEPKEGGVTITTKHGSETFAAVVAAATADVTAAIYPAATRGQKEVLKGTAYSATIGVGFVVPKDTLGEISIVWVPYVENEKIAGCTNEAMKGGELITDGKTLLFTWFHEDFARSIIDQSDEEIFALAKKELPKACPFLSAEILAAPYDLQRWPTAMPKYNHGHLERVKNFLSRHQGENNVFFCGDYLNSPWIEGALRCGERVAQAVLARRQ